MSRPESPDLPPVPGLPPVGEVPRPVRSGPPEFEAAAADAAAQLGAIPPDDPVRLRKHTSNLFRAREPMAAGLDLSAFTGVYSIDPLTRRAVVGGLTTYEDLVAATLPYGLLPLCVPQLRTITLGGAVTGMGIEAASFRNGMPHESVLAMDILIADGSVIHAAPDGPDSELFFGFPNSYGSLGYALRLEIELEPATRYIELRHLRFGSTAEVTGAIEEVTRSGSWDGQRVNYVDGTVFSGREIYLSLARYSDDPGCGVSDYTGQRIYYRSIRERGSDRLTAHDYIWRWDTDWFWCSQTFGTQRPLVRRLWPRHWLRSDFYWRIVAFDRRTGLSGRIRRLRRQPPREQVIQDVEVPLDRLGEFLEFFEREVGISPAWICPLRQRDPSVSWPLYEMDPDTVYVNIGFWSSVELQPGEDPAAGRINRAIEAKVSELNGRKSLYSTSFYGRDEFYRIYGQGRYRALKENYDPGGRFTGLYEKCVAGH